MAISCDVLLTFIFFFFQAEDGIRDSSVTGVQTCALPISLQSDQQLTRDEIYTLLQRARISVDGQRGYHILWRMGVDRIICFGARRGKQQTFTLLEEWAPKVRVVDSDTALAELTLRYFQGHGPATLPDFVWWSGLKISDARTGLALVSAQLESVTVNDTVYWMNPA